MQITLHKCWYNVSNLSLTANIITQRVTLLQRTLSKPWYLLQWQTKRSSDHWANLAGFNSTCTINISHVAWRCDNDKITSRHDHYWHDCCKYMNKINLTSIQHYIEFIVNCHSKDLLKMIQKTSKKNRTRNMGQKYNEKSWIESFGW